MRAPRARRKRSQYTGVGGKCRELGCCLKVRGRLPLISGLDDHREESNHPYSTRSRGQLNTPADLHDRFSTRTSRLAIVRLNVNVSTAEITGLALIAQPRQNPAVRDLPRPRPLPLDPRPCGENDRAVMACHRKRCFTPTFS